MCCLCHPDMFLYVVWLICTRTNLSISVTAQTQFQFGKDIVILTLCSLPGL